ncbi:hypothetical protein GGI15_003463 [Coemansia interrupta]|uniref:Uncharacterized protein n=1 Tax=Coemansia interrupta TaxID=1126814 RepID=A0A9W8LHG2_9FUNG|nr:hypothetical protein GGI15_003463 [Coemansia interrupta]
MGRVSASQVLHRLQRNGTYDAMREEMQAAFAQSPRGHDLLQHAHDMLQRATRDRAYLRLPSSERSAYLEQLLADRLVAPPVLERMDTEARNFWLLAERQAQMQRRIARAAREASEKDMGERAVCRALEVDPPRMSGAVRAHNFYRRGETVAAFVALGNALCGSVAYVCLAAEIRACDAARNAYTVVDPDAGSAGQSTWAVHWDQIMVNKRAHEYVFREGEQVYAVYREDAAPGDLAMQVTTEYYPGRVERVGSVSVAVRFDAGPLGHVYYDEVFAAGKIGFLRMCSEKRRRGEGFGGDAMVESMGRPVPSFTGFWPEQAAPELGKHGRRVRYRQPPPMLVPYEPRAEPRVGPRAELQTSHPASVQSLSAVSDMDMDTVSTASASSRAPSPTRVASSQPLPPLPPPQRVSHPAPRSRLPLSSDEEGEIGLPSGAREDGEFIDSAPAHPRHPPRPAPPQRPPVERPRRSRSPEDMPRHRVSRWDRRPEPEIEPEPRRYSQGMRYDERRSSYGGRDGWRRESEARGAWRRSPEPREWRRSPEHRERRRSRSRLPYAPYGEYDHR